MKPAEGLKLKLKITGTRLFMAIGILKSECNSYRHDLKSFVYISLWIIIITHTENPLKISKLRQ